MCPDWLPVNTHYGKLALPPFNLQTWCCHCHILPVLLTYLPFTYLHTHQPTHRLTAGSQCMTVPSNQLNLLPFSQSRQSDGCFGINSTPKAFFSTPHSCHTIDTLLNGKTAVTNTGYIEYRLVTDHSIAQI